MEFYELVKNRRSVRSYLDTPVEDSVLREILEAAAYAPSAVNLQPWYFVVIRSEEQRARLASVMEKVATDVEPNLRERFANHPHVAEESVRFIRSLGGAPVCILVFQYKPEYPKTQSTIIQSVAAAVENLLLAAADKSLGGCWMTAPIETGAGYELQALFAPGKGPLVTAITLGYPKHTPAPPARKEDRYIIL